MPLFLSVSCGSDKGYKLCTTILVDGQTYAHTSYETQRYFIGAYRITSFPVDTKEILGADDNFYLYTTYTYNYRTQEGYYKPLPSFVIASYAGVKGKGYLSKLNGEAIIETYTEAFFNESNRSIKTVSNYQRTLQSLGENMITKNNYFYKIQDDKSSTPISYKINFIKNSKYNLYVPDSNTGQLYKPENITTITKVGNNNTITCVYED